MWKRLGYSSLIKGMLLTLMDFSVTVLRGMRRPGRLFRKVQGSRCKVQGARLKVQGSRCKVQGSRLKVQGSRLKVGEACDALWSGWKYFKTCGNEMMISG